MCVCVCERESVWGLLCLRVRGRLCLRAPRDMGARASGPGSRVLKGFFSIIFSRDCESVLKSARERVGVAGRESSLKVRESACERVWECCA